MNEVLSEWVIVGSGSGNILAFSILGWIHYPIHRWFGVPPFGCTRIPRGLCAFSSAREGHEAQVRLLAVFFLIYVAA
jgi:hypothetical protein